MKIRLRWKFLLLAAALGACTSSASAQSCYRLACPDPIFARCEGALGTHVWYNVPVTNLCAGTPNATVVYSIPPGSLFPRGTNIVCATAILVTGQKVAECCFPVVVAGCCPTNCLELLCATNVVKNCQTTQFGPGAMVDNSELQPPVLTNYCGNPPRTVTTRTPPAPASGGPTYFRPGTNHVVWTVTDNETYTNSCCVEVVVLGCTPLPPCRPSIVCPPDIRANCTSPAGVAVKYAVQIITNQCPVNPPVTVSYSKPSESVFPPGRTTVGVCLSWNDPTTGLPMAECCCFDVVVNCCPTTECNPDKVPPVIQCPSNIVITCASPNGAAVNFTPLVSDNCDPNPVVTCNPPSGSFFPPGTTTVICQAVDQSGNTAACTFTVSVLPDVPPVLNVHREGNVLVVCWEKGCRCYTLQVSAGLPPNWINSPVSPVDTGSSYCVRLPLGDRKLRYFRLRACDRPTLPTYSVVGAGLTAGQVDGLAGAFNIPRAQLLLQNGEAIFVDPQNFQAIPHQPVQDPALIEALTRESSDNSGPFAFDGLNFAAIAKLNPPDQATALDLFARGLGQAGLMPTEGEPRVRHTMFEAVDTRGNPLLTPTALDTHVDFQFNLGGIPLTGPGAKVLLALGADGQPTALDYASRELKPGNAVPVITPTEALRRSGMLYPQLQPRDNPQLCYYAPPLSVPGVHTLIPYWECGGVADFGGEPMQLLRVLVPATDDPALVPQVTLNATANNNLVFAEAAVTGGTPPYTYEWMSSSTELSNSNAPTIQYTAQPRGPTTTEAVRVIVTDANGVSVPAVQVVAIVGGGAGGPGSGRPTPKVGGVNDYGCERAVSNMGAAQQTGFNNRFASGGYVRRFNFTGSSCWERDFLEGGNGLDSTYVDNADIVFYIGHGNGGGFTFESSQNDGKVSYPDVVGAWGDLDLEWLALLSCEVLKDTYNGVKWYDRWIPAFDGLHQLLGFETLAQDNSGFGAGFADWTLGRYNILPPMPIRLSWFLAKSQYQPSDRQAVVIGVIGPGGISNCNDYFWGRGSVGPDIRGSNIQGCWRIVYQ